MDILINYTASFEKFINLKIDKAKLKDCVSGNFHNKQTLFNCAYNEEGIFFSFECEDDDIFSTMKDFNANLYDEDVVEVFVCTDGNLKEYTEIEISPLENVLQLKVVNDLSGNIKTTYIEEDIIERKVFITGNGWKAFFFVPFKIFGSDAKAGDAWKFNAYRIDRAGLSRNYYSLNPTFKPEFHHPKHFVGLIFG